MSILRWEDPPEARRRGHWQQTAVALQENPGRWALIVEREDPKYAYDMANSALRRHGCETQTRSILGEVSVWARWPGLSEPPSGEATSPLRDRTLE